MWLLSPLPKNLIQRLQQVQYRALNELLGFSASSSSDMIHFLSGLLPTESRMQVLKYQASVRLKILENSQNEHLVTRIIKDSPTQHANRSILEKIPTVELNGHVTVDSTATKAAVDKFKEDGVTKIIEKIEAKWKFEVDVPSAGKAHKLISNPRIPFNISRGCLQWCLWKIPRKKSTCAKCGLRNNDRDHVQVCSGMNRVLCDSKIRKPLLNLPKSRYAVEFLLFSKHANQLCSTIDLTAACHSAIRIAVQKCTGVEEQNSFNFHC